MARHLSFLLTALACVGCSTGPGAARDADALDSGHGHDGGDGAPPADADIGDSDLDHADVGRPDGELELDGAEPDSGADAGSDAESDAEGPLRDLDGDGLADSYEDRLVDEYLPFLSIDPADGCPLSVVVYRIRPHPEDPSLLHLVVDMLFERDCGAAGHPGDNEVFGMTLDPSVPAPEGILAVRAISHQDTACQHVSSCGRCEGLRSCATAERRGLAYPVVYYSLGKHGAYTFEAACDMHCFFTNYCTLAPSSAEPPRINAGEPDAPLVRDLSEAGLITEGRGWTEESLFGYDPWGPTDFGEAGNVADDLQDDAFLTEVCHP